MSERTNTPKAEPLTDAEVEAHRRSLARNGHLQHNALSLRWLATLDAEREAHARTLALIEEAKRVSLGDPAAGIRLLKGADTPGAAALRAYVERETARVEEHCLKVQEQNEDLRAELARVEAEREKAREVLDIPEAGDAHIGDIAKARMCALANCQASANLYERQRDEALAKVETLRGALAEFAEAYERGLSDPEAIADGCQDALDATAPDAPSILDAVRAEAASEVLWQMEEYLQGLREEYIEHGLIDVAQGVIRARDYVRWWRSRSGEKTCASCGHKWTADTVWCPACVSESVPTPKDRPSTPTAPAPPTWRR